MTGSGDSEARGCDVVGPDRPERTRLQGWDAARARISEFGVFGPLALVLVGVGLDRAGFSAVGITLSFLGGVAFVVVLCVLARWGLRGIALGLTRGSARPRRRRSRA
jgi:hypothetical protein